MTGGSFRNRSTYLSSKADLAVLEALSDEDIHTSDIPEVTAWSDAVRGKFYRPVKKAISLRVDGDTG